MKALRWGGGFNLPGVHEGGRGGCLESKELAGVAPWFLELFGEKAFPRDGEEFAHLCAAWKTGRGAEPGHQSGKSVGKPFYKR